MVKILAKASQLATKFEGECLSVNCHISVVKGRQAIKFKCQQGHIFYKYTDELVDTSYGLRKSSVVTMASSSDEEYS
jgi:hypothetical protein